MKVIIMSSCPPLSAKMYRFSKAGKCIGMMSAEFKQMVKKAAALEEALVAEELKKKLLAAAVAEEPKPLQEVYSLYAHNERPNKSNNLMPHQGQKWKRK